jgi:hypothetical protein
MTNNKRSRGRPRGSGKNDDRHLAQVADLLVQEPSLTATAAMKRIMSNCNDWDAASEPALIRRWQSKWKLNGEALLVKARNNVYPKPASSDGSNGYPRPITGTVWLQCERMMDQQRRIQDLIDPPYMRFFREAQRMRDLIDPPYMRALREQAQRLR